MSPIRSKLVAGVSAAAVAVFGLSLAISPAQAAPLTVTEDTAFNNNTSTALSGAVTAAGVNSDGSIIVGGGFTGKLKKLNADGTDTGAAAAFNSNLGSAIAADVTALAIGSDAIVAGGGSTYNTGWVRKIAPDGDTVSGAVGTFNSNASSLTLREVRFVATLPNGAVLFGGGGSGYPVLKMLNADGTSTGAAATFDTNAAAALPSNYMVWATAVASDGSVFVGGGSSNQGFFMKLNADGTSTGTAATFNSNASFGSATVYSIAIAADGGVIIGGSFPGMLKKYNADGTSTGAAATFNTNAANNGLGAVSKLAVASDGSVFAGGNFTGKLNRFEADGTPDTGFASALGWVLNAHPLGSPEPYVSAVALQAANKVLVGGTFNGHLVRYAAPDSPGGSNGGGSTPAPTAQVAKGNVSFGAHSAKLSKSDKAKIKKLYKKAKASGTITKIKVTGYANPNKHGHYKKAAAKRASVVANYLKSYLKAKKVKNISVTKATAKGKSKTDRRTVIRFSYATS